MTDQPTYRPTNRQSDMRVHREVTLSIRNQYNQEGEGGEGLGQKRRGGRWLMKKREVSIILYAKKNTVKRL